MIQNPNEIAARQRMEEAMSRIEANVRARLQMNRRQFICGSAATMALAMLGLAGCSPKADANGNAGAQAYKAGTYEASAEGRNGAVNVKVTFTDDAIDAIDVEHEESRNIGDAAIDILKDKYLQSQSLNFDTVTGASLSSMAFATAVAECVDQAGGDVKALKKADTGIEPAAAIDEDCDVCVVGSGGAAFAAAVTAAEAGKTVVMLEKMDIYGGNTNAGEGTLNAPDPERQQPLGIEDSPDLFYQQTFEGGDELGDPALVRILADNALDAVHWMEDHGLVYEKEPFTAIGGLWQRGHAVEVEKKGEQGGSYYVSCLKDSADKTGKVTLYTDAKVEQLVEEDGKVTGVARNPSFERCFRCRAREVRGAGHGRRLPQRRAGHGVRQARDQGHALVECVLVYRRRLGIGRRCGRGPANMELVQIHPLGDPQNGGVATFVGNWLGVEDYVMVNDEGKRFIREDERRDTIADAILEQPNDETWLLVDSTDIAADRADQIAELVEKGHSFKADDIKIWRTRSASRLMRWPRRWRATTPA